MIHKTVGTCLIRTSVLACIVLLTIACAEKKPTSIETKRIGLSVEEIFKRFIFEEKQQILFSDAGEPYRCIDCKLIRIELPVEAPPVFIEKKKRELQSRGSLVLRSVDEDRIRALYDGLFGEPKVDAIVAEAVAESAQRETSDYKVYVAEGAEKAAKKVIEHYSIPEEPVEEKVKKLLAKLLEQNELTLDLETIITPDLKIRRVDEALDHFEKNHSVEVPDGTREALRTAIRSGSVESNLKKIRKAAGLAYISAQFKISRTQNGFNLKMRHPVSDMPGNRLIQISVQVPDQKLRDPYKDIFMEHVGSEVNVNVFGDIFGVRNTDSGFDITVAPIAIY